MKTIDANAVILKMQEHVDASGVMLSAGDYLGAYREVVKALMIAVPAIVVLNEKAQKAPGSP